MDEHSKNRKLKGFSICGFLCLSLFLTFVTEASSELSPLRTLGAKHKIEIGSAVSSPDNLKDKQYRDLFLKEFNLLVIGGRTLNWAMSVFRNDLSPFRPSRHRYEFLPADEMVDFAEKNNLGLRAHHLVWGEHKALPSWVLDGGFNREELLGLIKKHIQTVVSRYKGRIKEWTVVNETFSRRLYPNIWGGDFWYEHLGDEYVKSAFRWAREADPSATLILNDFGNERFTPISDEMYKRVKEWLAEGVPIDGIGMQMHLNAKKPPTKKDVIRNMRRFGDLGLKVYITEFDVDISGFLFQKKGLKVQADIYRDMVEACMESGVCSSFVVYEFSDAKTWYRMTRKKRAKPLPFDENFEPKPAYNAIREALSK